jgi:hypothetical protein
MKIAPVACTCGQGFPSISPLPDGIGLGLIGSIPIKKSARPGRDMPKIHKKITFSWIFMLSFIQ